MSQVKLPRRGVLTGLMVAVPVAAVVGRTYFFPKYDGEALSVAEAHRRAVSGDIFLIDIRRPDEWSATGSGEGAYRIDMRDDDFEDQLLAIVEDQTAPIALICARGVRSARMSNRLAAAGFTNIIDVPEGMLGSSAGPGWVESDLPVVRDEYTG